MSTVGYDPPKDFASHLDADDLAVPTLKTLRSQTDESTLIERGNQEQGRMMFGDKRRLQTSASSTPADNPIIGAETMTLLEGGDCVTGLYKARPSALKLNFRQKSRLGEIEVYGLWIVRTAGIFPISVIVLCTEGSQSLSEAYKVCLEIFFWSILLSCEHVFCFHCMQTWLLEHRDLKLTCPMCRGVAESPPLEEWQIGALSLLVRQHSGLLVKSLHMSKELLRFQEVMTLDASTANPFLVLSYDLRNVGCGKICHNPVEDPQRFTYLTCVLGTPFFSSGCHYWEVEVGEGKEWTLGSLQDL
ncbi:hypothetical protein GH733_000658 [Mirounga leonina]|nr:hypothetical protein GH733_000658 [Mirounga leonina]